MKRRYQVIFFYTLFIIACFFLQHRIAEQLIQTKSTTTGSVLADLVTTLVIATTSLLVYSGIMTSIAISAYFFFRKRDKERKISFGVCSLIGLTSTLFLVTEFIILD
jgi:uncharacterized membrane protein YgaE (UPF0421/DUF939 family)